MKFLLLALFAIAASAEIDYSAPEWNVDWSQAVPVEDMPGFWDGRDLPAAIFASNARSSRIVGGQEVVPHSHPYQASILMQFAGGSGLCGASWIGGLTILTAAHCPIGSVSTLVILGAHNRLVIEPSQQRQTIPSANYRLHPQYNSGNLNNDIAIMIAPNAWNQDAFVTPINLVPNDLLGETFAGQRGTSTGWGRTTNGGAVSDVLRSANNLIITNAECAAVYGTTVVNAGVICIETNQSNQGTCHGDSGGVLSVNQPEFGGLIQVGVTSFVASAGCVAGFPSGFERVSFHDSWIRENSQ